MPDGQQKTARKARGRVTFGELAVQAVLLVLVLAIFFPGVFLRGEMALPGELLHDLSPWREYVDAPETAGRNHATIEALTLFYKFYAVSKMALDAGEWPLWNHLEQTGMPLLANYQSAVLYPPRLLHAFLSLPLATTLYVLLKLWLCGFNAYLLGRGLNLRIPASRFLSIAWMASGFCMVWAYWTPTDVAAWVPLVLLGTEWLLDGRFRRGIATLLVASPLLMLAGQPQVAFIFALGLGVYTLLRLATDGAARQRMPAKILGFGAAWGFAVLASMAQVLPFVEYVSHAADVKTRMGLDIEQFSYLPSSVVGLWVPRFFGTDIEGNYWYDALNPTYVGMLYAGIVVWACFPCAFLGDGGLYANRRRVIALAVTATAFALLAWRHPALGFIYGLPILSSVRPAYFTAFALFVLPVLAAIGVDRWTQIRPGLRALAPSLAALALAGLGAGALFMFQRSTLAMEGLDDFVLRRLVVTAALAGAAFLVLMVQVFRRAPWFVGNALTMLVLVDLVIASAGFHHTIQPDKVLPSTALTDYLAELEKPNRVSVVTAGITLGLFPCYGIETWMGYDALYPKRIVELREGFGDRFLSTFEPACGISHYLYLAGTPPYPPLGDPVCLERLATLDGVDVYQNTCALPRAYLAARVLDVPDAAARFSLLGSGGLNPRYRAIIEDSLPGPQPSAELSDLGAVEVLRRTPTRVELRASSKADCVLVLADAYYPGWKATVDGESVDVFPVNHAFRGLLMPAGEHGIEFRYVPGSFRLGLTVSVAVLALGAFFAIVLLWTSPPARMEGSR